MKDSTTRNALSKSILSLFLLPIIVCLSALPRTTAAEWHGELLFLSDYIYRGYSKSRSNPVVQGHLDYQDDAGWFSGLSLSQVNFDDHSHPQHAEVEFKPYLGWTLPLSSDWRTELSATGYIYNDKVFAHDAHYVEFYSALHYRDWLSARMSVAPNAYQRHVAVANYEVNFRRDIFDTLQFSMGLGYYQAGALLGDDYFYWNAGASWFVTPHLALDIRYVDADLPANDSTGGHHHGEFYPRPQENNYLVTITLGF